MKKLILFLALISASVNANLYTWVAPIEREDNTKITLDEIANFRLYYGYASGSYTDSVLIDKSLTSYDLTVPDGDVIYAVMTTIDTDGRESKYSTEVVSTGIEPIPIYPSAPIANLTVTKVPALDYDYVFSFAAPDKYSDGGAMPAGEIVKYYLFDNDKWVADIMVGNSYFTRILSVGDHSFETEVETRKPDGTLQVSARSAPVVVNVTKPLVAPKPPTEFNFVIPDGFQATVLITPVAQ